MAKKVIIIIESKELVFLYLPVFNLIYDNVTSKPTITIPRSFTRAQDSLVGTIPLEKTSTSI
jgi:hypothetical protein